jgi:quercetin dioxygenase-like cupin family protein
MRHFQQIAGNVDTVPLLNALVINQDLWNEVSVRTSHPASPHVQADDILVFFNEIPADPTQIMDDIQTKPYRAWAAMPQLRPLVFDLMRRVEATQLGRVVITRLAPGARIAPHVDEGAPATFYSRYQVALKSNPGALFRIEEETVNFATGDAWWVDNRLEHEVINNSDDDRIALIIDLRVPTP